MSYRTAKIGFGLGGIATLFLLSLLPAVGAFSGNSAAHPNIAFCTVSFVSPSGTFAQGATVNAYVTSESAPNTYCSGGGAWFIFSTTNSYTNSGSFSCTSSSGASPCNNYKFFSSSTLPPGNYYLLVVFAGQNFGFGFDINNFFVAAELPLGAALAVIAPLGALLAFAKFRRVNFFN